SPSATARAIGSLSVPFTGAPRSRGSRDLGRDLGRGDGAAGTPAARRRTPSPIRTLTLGPDFAPRPPPGRLPWASGLPQPAVLPAVTAGPALHPTPHGSAL